MYTPAGLMYILFLVYCIYTWMSNVYTPASQVYVHCTGGNLEYLQLGIYLCPLVECTIGLSVQNAGGYNVGLRDQFGGCN